MIRGEETDDPVTGHTPLTAEGPPDSGRPESGGEEQEPFSRLAVSLSDDGSAAIDGEPVPVVPGEPVDVAILDTLHGYARSRNAPVTAAISDPSAGYAVTVEVAPDGSSTVLERSREATEDRVGEPAGQEAGRAAAAGAGGAGAGEGAGAADGPALPPPGFERDADPVPHSARPQATGATAARGPRRVLLRAKPQSQSDDEYEGPGLLQRPAVIGGVALGAAVLVMGSLVALGSSGEQHRAAGASNEADAFPGTGRPQMYPPLTGSPSLSTPSPSASSPPPQPSRSAPQAGGPDAPHTGPPEDADSGSDHGAASSRRGVALNPVPGTAKALVDSGASWFHNWTSSTGELGTPGKAEYVPMVWGPGSVTRAELASAKKESGGHLLTFHEPDSSAQSGISPERALELWPWLEETGLRLGSPAVAGGADKEGGWLDRFMRGAEKRDLRVDFISVHWYGSDFGPGATQKLRSHLQAVHKRYNKPVWLTEYALADFSGDAPRYPSEKQRTDFITSSTDMLESLGFVERYAWSALSTETNPTGLYDGSAPNSGGRAYREAD